MRILLFFVISNLLSFNCFAEQMAKAATIRTNFGYQIHDSRQNLRNRVMPNVGLGYNFTKNLNLELNFGYLTTKDKNKKPNVSEIQRYNASLTILDLEYNLFAKDSIDFFISTGVGGISYYKVNDNRKHDATYLLGAGLRHHVNNKTALGVSGKWLRINGKDNYNSYLLNIFVQIQLL